MILDLNFGAENLAILNSSAEESVSGLEDLHSLKSYIWSLTQSEEPQALLEPSVVWILGRDLGSKQFRVWEI